MVPHRIGAKIFFENTPDLTLFIPIFHKWIRNSTVDGMLVDVADYKHVADGPGVMLIGHEGDFAIDLAQGRAGLSYVHKREWADPDGDEALVLQYRIGRVLGMLQQGAEALRNERKLRKVVRFVEGELQIGFYDQLRTPNTDETFVALQRDIGAALAATYAGAAFDLQRVSQSPTELLTVNVTIREAALAA